MIIAGFNIQPLLLHLPDTKYWQDRYEKGKKHFEEIGLKDIISVAGVYADGFGLVGTHPYKIDGDDDYIITPAKVGSFLSMYVMYNVANVLPNGHFMILEDDSRMKPNFLSELNWELQNVPKDFDFLFLGSCCAMDKNPIHVKGKVFTFEYDKDKGVCYPMGGHCYIVAKKALHYIISTQRDCYAPADISLPIHTFPNLKVYAILPRLAEQDGVENLAP